MLAQAAIESNAADQKLIRINASIISKMWIRQILNAFNRAAARAQNPLAPFAGRTIALRCGDAGAIAVCIDERGCLSPLAPFAVGARIRADASLSLAGIDWRAAGAAAARGDGAMETERRPILRWRAEGDVELLRVLRLLFARAAADWPDCLAAAGGGAGESIALRALIGRRRLARSRFLSSLGERARAGAKSFVVDRDSATGFFSRAAALRARIDALAGAEEAKQ